MNEARHLLSKFERQDLWHEANNLVVALNLSLLDELTPFETEKTQIAICDDLFDHLVGTEVHMRVGFSLDDGLDCIRDIWERILKLDRAKFENYRISRGNGFALIEAISLNENIGCAVEITLYPANNVFAFPSMRSSPPTLSDD